MPSQNARLHPDAERDIEEGLGFYAIRSRIVAERFLSEIDAAIALVAEAPERWTLARGGMRRYVMAAFPYSIVCRVVAGEIQVFAVAHAKRRPRYWKARRF